MAGNSLSRHIADAARELQGETGAQDTMDKTVKLAVGLVEHCEEAGISLVRPDKSIDTPAATSDSARKVDELQYQFGEGPCLDAIHQYEVVSCPDLANETRWNDWGARTARETGVRSMLCFRLFTNQDTVGALNLYATIPDAFDTDDRDQGLALAAHAAIAVAGAQNVDHLRVAMDRRNLIGQAQGILMERYELDSEQAFAVLVRASSNANVKLREIATQLVQNRRISRV